VLTALRESDGAKVAAWEAARADRPFVCACCRRIVTLRRGAVIAPHFAHQPPVVCEYGAGESEAHRRCKLALYEALRAHPSVSKCEVERDLGAVRPDVSAYVGDTPVAFEVQLSALPLARIAQRTAEYARRGVYVLWLPPHADALARELYEPRPWERWLHAAYFGRVYYWLEGLTVRPVHFRDFYARARGRTRDFDRLSRRKVPLEGPALSLVEDFAPRRRAAWAGRGLVVPDARLFADTRPKWY
jgi:competence protein CoiA